jgi:hypothetical protein
VSTIEVTRNQAVCSEHHNSVTNKNIDLRCGSGQPPIETANFVTNIVPNSVNGGAIVLEARLFPPEATILTIPSVVITPSSAGIRFEREIYYAEELARAGVAAFVIDSFARGAFRTLSWISKL